MTWHSIELEVNMTWNPTEIDVKSKWHPIEIAVIPFLPHFWLAHRSLPWDHSKFNAHPLRVRPPSPQSSYTAAAVFMFRMNWGVGAWLIPPMSRLQVAMYGTLPHCPRGRSVWFQKGSAFRQFLVTRRVAGVGEAGHCGRPPVPPPMKFSVAVGGRGLPNPDVSIIACFDSVEY